MSRSTAKAWIKNPLFDLSCIVLSPLFSLVLLFLYLNDFISSNALLPISFLFFALLEFPHVGLTTVRIHGDKKEFYRHPVFYTFGLMIFFGLGQMIAFFEWNEFTLLFVNILSIWHISRQNFGFMRVYSRNTKIPLPPYLNLVYLATVFSGYLFDEFHSSRFFIHLLGDTDSELIFKTLMVSGTLYMVAHCLYLGSQVKKIPYQVISLILLSILVQYTLLASKVPLIVYIMALSIYHNIQYISWIYFYYSQSKSRLEFKKYWIFILLLACLVLAAFYSLNNSPIYPYAEMAYLSLLVYHFLVDGWVWKFHSKPELKALLS